jgi:hypothetical protein
MAGRVHPRIRLATPEHLRDGEAGEVLLKEMSAFCPIGQNDEKLLTFKGMMMS